jgi:hypothetical protein
MNKITIIIALAVAASSAFANEGKKKGKRIEKWNCTEYEYLEDGTLLKDGKEVEIKGIISLPEMHGCKGKVKGAEKVRRQRQKDSIQAEKTGIDKQGRRKK